MKVVLCSLDNPYRIQVGGKHIHLLLLERALRMYGLDIHTLYYDPTDSMEILREAVTSYATVLLPESLRIVTKQWSRLKGHVFFFRRHLGAGRFDIVHAHDVVALEAADWSQKTVLTIHGYFAREMLDSLEETNPSKSPLYFLYHKIENSAIWKADHVIAVDSRIRDYVVSEFSYPRSKISVIYNAIDTDRFVPVNRGDQRKTKSMLGFGEDNFIVLVPRRLVKKNGVIYAARSMEYVRDRRVRMIIAGDGPEMSSVLRETRDDKRIILVGAVPHERFVEYCMAADVLLIPSITSHGIQEATSLAALEGMSCGKLVISTDIGGLREIVSNGRGLTVDEKNPLSIAETICRAQANDVDIEEIGRCARQYVLENHSYIAQANKVIDVYKKIG